MKKGIIILIIIVLILGIIIFFPDKKKSQQTNTPRATQSQNINPEQMKKIKEMRAKQKEMREKYKNASHSPSANDRQAIEALKKVNLDKYAKNDMKGSLKIKGAKDVKKIKNIDTQKSLKKLGPALKKHPIKK